MDQPMVDVIVIIKRMYLSFIRQPAEWCGKNDPVVILHKDRPVLAFDIFGIAHPFRAKKRGPLHRSAFWLFQRTLKRFAAKLNQDFHNMRKAFIPREWLRKRNGGAAPRPAAFPPEYL
jgi:hypothetical protein